MRGRTLLFTLTAIVLLMNSSARASLGNSKKFADDFPSEVASTWFELLYDVVKAERTTPPPASRIYGVTAVALYESIVAGTNDNRSLIGQLNGLESVPKPKTKKKLNCVIVGRSIRCTAELVLLPHHWPTVANTVLANTIRGLYPTISQSSLDAINNLEQSFAAQYEATVPGSKYQRSVSHGQAVAAAILTWAASDGFAIYNNCPYIPAPVPGAWQPAPPAFNPNPLQPCWGLLRPMVLTSATECPPQGHVPFSTDPGSDFYAAGLEVYNVNLALTTEQKAIADYWSDEPVATGTPAGHWIAIVSQIARNDDLSLAEAAEAYARVGIAVHDAFIACWNGKYAHNLQRPVTYINNNIVGAQDWKPYIVTPNFPAYTSGHSTQSGAAARVLTDMFGIKSFTDTTHSDHGLMPPQQPRTFNSFDEAAAEAAVSRLYGGIHFSFDNNHGLTCGQCIGQTIHDRVSFKIE